MMALKTWPIPPAPILDWIVYSPRFNALALPPATCAAWNFVSRFCLVSSATSSSPSLGDALGGMKSFKVSDSNDARVSQLLDDRIKIDGHAMIPCEIGPSILPSFWAVGNKPGGLQATSNGANTRRRLRRGDLRRRWGRMTARNRHRHDRTRPEMPVTSLLASYLVRSTEVG